MPSTGQPAETIGDFVLLALRAAENGLEGWAKTFMRIAEEGVKLTSEPDPAD